GRWRSHLQAVRPIHHAWLGSGFVSPRGEAASDEIVHEDAADDDRDPEPQLVAESFCARLHELAHGAEHSAGRENRQTVAAHQAQWEEGPGPPHRSGEPGMVDDVGKCEEMHEPRESEIALAAVEYVVRVLPEPRCKAEGIGAHGRSDRDDREASSEEPRVVGDTAAL